MISRRQIGFALAALGALAGGFLLWRALSPPPVNVLFVTLDTTRADRLGCYGAAEARTPALDRLAGEGVRFTRACTHVPLTLPSHATMLTGLLPAEHGVRDNAHTRLSASTPTLPAEFRRRGYRTAAFLASFVLDRRFGLDAGFDVYDDRMRPPPRGENVFSRQNPGDVVCDRALAWLEANSRRPFFCWVHFYDPHMPCTPPPPYDRMFADPYDGAIAFMDTQVGRLLAFLDQRGLRDRTLVVICGDHGEGFGEHGENGHGLLVYQETMHVPLFLRWPGRIRPAVSDRLVSLSQIPSTVQQALGWRSSLFRGDSLLAPAAADDPACCGETLYPFLAYRWAPLACLTTARWKYILAPEPELYDLAADPQERHNLAAAQPQVADDLKLRLEEARARLHPASAEPLPLDRQTLAQLRSLGYVAGGAGVTPAAAETATALPNPVRMVSEVHNPLGRARILQDQGDCAGALAIVQRVLPKSPDSEEVFSLGMEAALGLGQGGTNALPYIRGLLRLDPNNRIAIVNDGGIALEQGRFEEAVRLYRKALALPPGIKEPTSPAGVSAITTKARCNLGVCLTNLKRLEEAAEAYRSVLADDPNHLEANNNLGNVFVLLKRKADAIRQFRQALAIDPTLFRTRENLGWLLCETGGYDEAFAVWRKGLELRPGDAVYLYHLAWWLATGPDAAHRDGREAVRLATELCNRTTWSNAQALDCLAAACAEAGNYAAATNHAAQGVARAQESPDGAALAAEMTSRLALYRQAKPFRQPAPAR
jgi:arylsulfatase A-like enzyme/Flp pilus assembly protein TadD